MTVKLSSIASDIVREQEGDWIDYPDWPGVKFHVRSLNHPPYKTARDLLLQKMIRRNKGKPLQAETMTVEQGRLYADHILLGWDGFDVPYSEDVARQDLTDPRHRNLVGAVEWCASRVGELDVEFVEDAEKNSGTGQDIARRSFEVNTFSRFLRVSLYKVTRS